MIKCENCGDHSTTNCPKCGGLLRDAQPKTQIAEPPSPQQSANPRPDVAVAPKFPGNGGAGVAATVAISAPSAREAEAERARLFDPARLPPPDEDGWFMHPDLGAIYGDDEVSCEEANRRLALRGWESEYVSGEHLMDADTLEYKGVREWNPEPPAGHWNREWQLVSVYDTEDGPYAQFVRPKPHRIGTNLLTATEAEAMLRHVLATTQIAEPPSPQQSANPRPDASSVSVVASGPAQQEADEEEQLQWEREETAVYDLSVWLMEREGDERDPHHLLYEGGPIPEPWGEVWQKYEDDARKLFAIVEKAVEARRPQPPREALTDDEILALAHKQGWFIETAHLHGTITREGLLAFARALLAAEATQQPKNRDATDNQNHE